MPGYRRFWAGAALAGACLLGGLSSPSLAAAPPDDEHDRSQAAALPNELSPAPESLPAESSPFVDQAVQPQPEVLPLSNELVVPATAPAAAETAEASADPVPTEDVPTDLPESNPEPAARPREEPQAAALPEAPAPSEDEDLEPTSDLEAEQPSVEPAAELEAGQPSDELEPSADFDADQTFEDLELASELDAAQPTEDLESGLAADRPSDHLERAADLEAVPQPAEAPAPGAGAEIRLDDRMSLLHVLKSEPSALGALSIGSPDGGLLFNPLPMPEGALWSIRDPRETYATSETIDFLVYALEEVEARHPGSPRLLIGDMSQPDGGRLNRHRSHQAGRDADLGFYYLTGSASAFRKPGRNELDLARTWTLVRTLVTGTDVQRIFLDRAHQRSLHGYAVAQGEDPEWLDDIFGRKTAGKDAIIQHERRHHDHMHVRFFNPGAQEKGRMAYPLLVEAGLVPGPTLTHRVRPGETLSHLARRYGASASAIRAANRLRGTSLRAGRSYVIPVRKIPQIGDPVVVPPRRLPRELKADEAPAAILAPAERADAGGEPLQP